MSKTEYHRNIVKFVKNFAEDPDKMKSDRIRLKDNLFAMYHSVSVTTVRNYMGSPDTEYHGEKLTDDEIVIINSRRKNGETDVVIAKDYKMSPSTLSRYCGTRKAHGISYKKKISAKEFPELKMEDIIPIPKIDIKDTLTEQQREYEETWKKDCIDSCGSINISAYIRRSPGVTLAEV